jgi:hypothetical protein
VSHGVGFAFHFDAVNSQATVGLGVAVPSPYFYNITASAVSVTADTLERQDRSLDFSVVYTLPTRDDRVRIRIWGGPTYFYVTSNMVSSIVYNQAATFRAPLNSVAIANYTQGQVSGFAFGVNVGADVSWFFSRYVGVGGGVRFNRGTVTVLEPLSNQNADLTVGHTQLGGGLRLRF